MQIIRQLNDFDMGFDVSSNPEIILMRRQQDDEQECDVEESMWYAGTAVTKPKSTDY